MTYWDYSSVKEVDWLNGCALLMRRNALYNAGVLNYIRSLALAFTNLRHQVFYIYFERGLENISGG